MSSRDESLKEEQAANKADLLGQEVVALASTIKQEEYKLLTTHLSISYQDMQIAKHHLSGLRNKLNQVTRALRKHCKLHNLDVDNFTKEKNYGKKKQSDETLRAKLASSRSHIYVLQKTIKKLKTEIKALKLALGQSPVLDSQTLSEEAETARKTSAMVGGITILINLLVGVGVGVFLAPYFY